MQVCWPDQARTDICVNNVCANNICFATRHTVCFFRSFQVLEFSSVQQSSSLFLSTHSQITAERPDEMSPPDTKFDLDEIFNKGINN